MLKKDDNALTQVGNKALDIYQLFESVFSEDVRFKIIHELSNREGANLREMARCCGISHKNISKYLDTLMRKGVVQAYPIGSRIRVYRLASRYDFLREFVLGSIFLIVLEIGRRGSFCCV